MAMRIEWQWHAPSCPQLRHTPHRPARSAPHAPAAGRRQADGLQLFSAGLLASLQCATAAWAASSWPIISELNAAGTPVETTQPAAELRPAGPLPAPTPVQAPALVPDSTFPPLPRTLPPLADIRLEPVRKLRLPNGMQVYLMEDHEVPLVKAALLMKGGRHASPANKVGLATVAAAVQRSGGTVSLPVDKLDDELDSMVATIELAAASDTIGMDQRPRRHDSISSTLLPAGFESLKEDLPRVMGLAVDVLTQPAIPDSKLDLARSQVLDIIRHSKDDAAELPRRALTKLLYGSNSVFARTATAEQVTSFTRQDVLDYLAAWERPDTSILGMVGDFDPVEVQRLVEAQFSRWQVAASQPSTPPDVPVSPLPAEPFRPQPKSVLLIDRPDASQTSIAVGELGVMRTSPDAPGLTLLSELLNGFGGSLFDGIRSRQGLAYSIGGGWDVSPVDHPGLFVAEASTAYPAQLVDLLMSSLQSMVDDGPSQAAVLRAQRQGQASFVFNVASTTRQLQQIVSSASHGLPENELFLRRDRIQALSAPDLAAVAKTHLHPADQVLVISADAKTLAPALREKGFIVTVYQPGELD